jgi:23S rRNA (cytidine2498-2'-O)-methyltransferase
VVAAKPLDWMVCDMVESPKRWPRAWRNGSAKAGARHAIFNLKLPMKKRWDETREMPGDVRAQAAASAARARAAALPRPVKRSRCSAMTTPIESRTLTLD